MRNVTRRSGMRRKRTVSASAPTSSSGASARSQCPSLRSRRSPASSLARISSIISPLGSQRSPPFGGSAVARLALPNLHHVVERVTLDGDLAGVADHAEELVARHPGRGLGAREVL